MTDCEIYDLAQQEITNGDLDSWLDGQPDDVLTRLYAGLTRARDNTFIVRSDADRDATAAHTGRVVIRDEDGIDGNYGWDDWCLDACLLDAVTETLGGRLYARVSSTQDTLAVALEALPGDGLRVLTDYPAVISRRVESWMRYANNSGEELAA